MNSRTKQEPKTSRQMTSFTEAQDHRLREIAQNEGCSVADLIRRAAIRQFLLPVGAMKYSTEPQNGAEGPESQPQGVKAPETAPTASTGVSA